MIILRQGSRRRRDVCSLRLLARSIMEEDTAPCKEGRVEERVEETPATLDWKI